MKKAYRTAALLLAIALLLPASGGKASAMGATEYIEAKWGTTYNLADYAEEGSPEVNFKLVVPDSIAIVVKGTDNHDGYVRFSAYKDLTQQQKVRDYSLFNTSGSEKVLSTNTTIIVLEQGTYYLNFSSLETNMQRKIPEVKVTFTQKKITNKKNYRQSKAVAWKKGKSIQFTQTNRRNYSRWYKISLKKKQKVTFTVYAGNSTPDLYTADGEYIDTTRSDSGEYVKYVTEKLPKGTYYVCIEHMDIGAGNVGPLTGEYQKFGWK